ncbi:hypothetical protein [Devosia alba]|uniref:hypothetical protein n=1 Tax=Devosia alba TaxID=3152360 RepID=UPI0032667E32
MTNDAPKGRTVAGRFTAGNPGRPRGARHKTTVAVEKLLDADARAITKKAIDLAKGGDTTALRLCLERIAPPRRGRPVLVTGMPTVTTASDVPAAISFIIAAVAAGELTTDEAADVTAILDKFVKAIEITDLEQRLKDIEGRLGHGA